MPATIPAHELRPGDLLLHASKGEVSKLIMWASDSEYSHIAMVIEPGLLAEARSAGVLFAEDLAKRLQGIGPAFHKIDAVRLRQPDPLHPEVLKTLQEGARSMAGAKFALNDMFQLGVIAALRNKLPGDAAGQWLLTQILNVIVAQDPHRLVCSEFIYLAFHRAQTEPPGLIDPEIVVVDRPDRPWPKDLDWLKLWREYRDASHAGGAALEAQAFDGSPLKMLQGQAADKSLSAECLAAMARTRAHLGVRRTEQFTSLQAIVPAETQDETNPELTLPQDFHDSPTFQPLGTIVP
jgi:hypothetical protein